MRTDLNCLPCILNQMIRAINKTIKDEKNREIALREVLYSLYEADWKKSPMIVAYNAFKKVKEISNVKDPFYEDKREQNKKALEIYPKLKEMVTNSDDPLFTAVKLAIVGNVIDLGPGHDFEIEQAVEESAKKDLKINHYDMFKKLVGDAQDILYIADNAGEIVFDKVLLEQLKEKKITFVIRAQAVANDALYEDAIEVGIDKLAKIEKLDLLAQTPVDGKTLEDMQEMFQIYDVIISKGQANFELFDEYSGNTFFLLKVKCQPIATVLNAEIGDLILLYNKMKE